MNPALQFPQIVVRIIHEQELVIGPLAWDEAKKVSGLNIVDSRKGEVSISGDQKEVVNKLVAQYERIFGRASHAISVCKQWLKRLFEIFSLKRLITIPNFKSLALLKTGFVLERLALDMGQVFRH